MGTHVGIKLTHDAAIAVIRDGHLECSIEAEKIGNNVRHALFKDEEEAFAALGYLPGNGRYTKVIDGWKGGILRKHGGKEVAPYHQHDGRYTRALTCYRAAGYDSYQHVTGHIIGSYAMSPFARYEQPCGVLVWDGGVEPRLYYVNPKDESPLKYIGRAFSYYAILYSIMGYYFGPFRRDDTQQMNDGSGDYQGQYDWPGKFMAYIAEGEEDENLTFRLGELFDAIGARKRPDDLTVKQDGVLEHSFMSWARKLCDRDDATIMLAIHNVIRDGLVAFCRDNLPSSIPLIFTGGSALSIKWNSALRSSRAGGFWVPPCPNDSGSAIGQAATSMAVNEGRWAVDWSVYSGPEAVSEPMPGGWEAAECNARGVGAALAADPSRAVIAVHGRAEIGPRALGHRSILMSPAYSGSKDYLNRIKKREGWRPVAPMVLEELAGSYFSPGGSDPYMLFDHEASQLASEMAPAILHLDNTARMQSVGRDGCPKTRDILSSFFAKTGCPVLCNTSANRNGSGFFPSAASAASWVDEIGEAIDVWDGSKMWRKM